MSTELQDIYPVIWRRRGTLLAAAVAGAVLAVVVSIVAPVSYTSMGTLLIGSREQWAGNNDAAMAQQDVQTGADMIRSPALADAVVQKLDLARSPALIPVARIPSAVADWLANVGATLHGVAVSIGLGDDQDGASAIDPAARAALYLQKNTLVTTTEHSNVVAVRFTAATAELAADVTNAIMAQFISQQTSAQAQRSQMISQDLIARAANLKEEADAAELKAKRYRDEQELRQSPGESVAIAKLTTAQNQLALARDDLNRQQAALEAARSGTSQTALTSPLIESLQLRQTALAGELDRLGGRHPDRIAIERNLAGIQQQISAETNRIVESMARDAAVARERAAGLEQAVQQATVAANKMSAGELTFADLTRDAADKRQAFNAFQTRANEIQVAVSLSPLPVIASTAIPTEFPDGLPKIVTLVFGTVGGVLVAAVAIMLGHLLANRINTAKELSDATGLPNIGVLPELRRSERARPAEALSESLRGVWLAARSLATSPQLVMLVSSCEIGDGKTTISSSLARRVAADGQRVLLIEADLRRPALSKVFGFHRHRRQCVESLLAGDATLSEAVTVDAQSGVHCLLSTGEANNPIKLLSSSHFADLLHTARQHYDAIIIDTPPALRVADAVLISHVSDVVLMVIGCGRHAPETVTDAIGRFRTETTTKIATILTRVPRGQIENKGYYSGYPAVKAQRRLEIAAAERNFDKAIGSSGTS